MIALWPADLPGPDREGFSLGLAGGAVTTDPDEGPPVTRLRQSLTGRPIRWQCTLTARQKAVLETWWEVDVRRGARPFLMREPTRDGWPLLGADGAPLLLPGGVPLLVSAWLLLMMSSQSRPEIRPRGRSSNQFVVSCQATVMP